MITLYSKDFATEYGAISSLCEAFVEEERNGLFELSFIMLNTDKDIEYLANELAFYLSRKKIGMGGAF